MSASAIPVGNLREVQDVDERYRLETGTIYLTGSQALVRLLLLQAQRDREAGLNTAGFVSGYRGSPLGGLDGILGAASPHRTMPLLAVLFAADEAWAGSLTHHVAFGAALGLLYGEGRARRGRREVV